MAFIPPRPQYPFPQFQTGAQQVAQAPGATPVPVPETPAYGMGNPYAQGSFADFPPELLMSALGTQGDMRDLSAMEKQLAQAEALRDDNSMPEGRSNGRVYTAANPLEFIGKGLQQYGAMKKARKLEADTQAKRDTIKGNEQRTAAEWAKGRGAKVPGAAVPEKTKPDVYDDDIV